MDLLLNIKCMAITANCNHEIFKDLVTCNADEKGLLESINIAIAIVFGSITNNPAITHQIAHRTRTVLPSGHFNYLITRYVHTFPCRMMTVLASALCECECVSPYIEYSILSCTFLAASARTVLAVAGKCKRVDCQS